jgi:serine/threonine protein phosphatase PrpC
VDTNIEGLSIFAIFDGHGGSKASEYLSSHFAPIFLSHFKNDVVSALEKTFK